MKYVTHLDVDDGGVVAPGLSTSRGVSVTGARMHVGLVHKARGTGSRPHSHKNEQFNYVLKGTLMGEIAGEPFVAPAGSVIHIPADTLHTIIASPDDEDVIFYVAKDTAAGLGEATPEDGAFTGARYESGFEPKE